MDAYHRRWSFSRFGALTNSTAGRVFYRTCIYISVGVYASERYRVPVSQLVKRLPESFFRVVLSVNIPARSARGLRAPPSSPTLDVVSCFHFSQSDGRVVASNGGFNPPFLDD